MINGCKTIAEYAIRRWMEHENFAAGYFTLIMNGTEGTVKDRSGDSLILEYDPKDKSVRVKD